MDVSASVGFRQRPGWLAIVVVLLAAQGWLTLRLFTSDDSFNSLLDDRPILTGRHPLHYYHGMLGARTWLEQGTSCCFDPAYQAGYPKTPVFDGGSRPAEFFEIIGGQRPAAYKIGLAIGSLLVPLAFIAMARGINMSPATSCLGGLLGAIVWWSEPCQALLYLGDVDLLLGGLCVLLHVTWFVRFERTPSLDSWFLMTLFAAMAWYAQPLLVVGFLPFLLLYYLWVATRQGPIWHLAVVAAVLVAFGVNANWLIDWAKNLWLYLPCGGLVPPPAPLWPTLAKEWTSLLPKGPLPLGVAAIGLAGLLLMLRTNRSAAWLLGVGALEYVAFACAGKSWPVLTDFGSEKALILGLWCLVLPAAALLSAVGTKLGEASGWRLLGPVWVLAGLAAVVWGCQLPQQWLDRPPLEIGLDPEREEVVRALVDNTTPDARILWEDRSGHTWTALLATLTERPYLGGLDPDGRLEHMYARLANDKLGNKPLADWSDLALLEFCERYNVGWVVCWSPDSVRRFRSLAFAKPIMELNDRGHGTLFRLDRKPSYILKGSGRWTLADSHRIALSDVVPEDGEVVLSIHYQSGMRISPGYIQIERDIDLDDPIPFIRLRVPAPVSRISIVWDNP
jgi:hypothetical protein